MRNPFVAVVFWICCPSCFPLGTLDCEPSDFPLCRGDGCVENQCKTVAAEGNFQTLFICSTQLIHSVAGRFCTSFVSGIGCWFEFLVGFLPPQRLCLSANRRANRGLSQLLSSFPKGMAASRDFEVIPVSISVRVDLEISSLISPQAITSSQAPIEMSSSPLPRNDSSPSSKTDTEHWSSSRLRVNGVKQVSLLAS